MENTHGVDMLREDAHDKGVAAEDPSTSLNDSGGTLLADAGAGLQSLVDPDAIGRLKARIRQEGVDELLGILFEDIPQRLTALNEAAGKSDRKALYSISHILKSSSGTLGLIALYDQCKALSDVCHRMPMIEAQYRVESIEEVYRQTAALLYQNYFSQGQKERDSK